MDLRWVLGLVVAFSTAALACSEGSSRAGVGDGDGADDIAVIETQFAPTPTPLAPTLPPDAPSPTPLPTYACEQDATCTCTDFPSRPEAERVYQKHGGGRP